MDYLDTINYLAFILLILVIIITGLVYYKSYSRKLKDSKIVKLPVARPINMNLYYFNPFKLSDKTSNLYLDYSNLFNQNIKLRKKINRIIKEHECNTLKTLRLLTNCDQLIRQSPEPIPFKISLKKNEVMLPNLNQLKKVFVFRVPEWLFGLGGIVTGGLIILFLWSFIQNFGSASTGTPISSLHGAAEFNATLAQFGFGSKSSGGGGKAFGVFVILFIVGCVTWLFMENYINYIVRKENQLNALVSKLQSENITLSLKLITIIDELAIKREEYNQLNNLYQATYKSIYPNKWDAHYIKYKLGMFSSLPLESQKHILSLKELEKLIRKLYGEKE